MANGDVKSQMVSAGRITYALQDATAAADTVGVWVDCREYLSGLVVITGITTATVEIDVHNSVTPPSPADNGAPYQAALSANGIVTIPSLPNWIKARIPTWTSGTVNVYASLRAAISS